jgi:tetratricopeptide (TPR) repeat protein
MKIDGEKIFLECLTAYRAQPSRLPCLPLDDPDKREAFHQAAKEAVNKALDHNDLATADAVSEFSHAVARYTKADDDLAWANWCTGLSLFNRDADMALTSLEAARVIYHRASRAELEGRVLVGCVGLYATLGQYEHASQAADRASSLLADRPDYPGWPALWLNKSFLALRLSNFVLALDYSRQAYASAAEFGQHDVQARALINAAIAHTEVGQVREARSALEEAERLATGIASSSGEIEGQVMLNLGRLLSYQGNLVAALAHFGQARTAFERAGMDADQATVDMDLSGVYEQLLMFREAGGFATRAAATFRKAHLQVDSLEASLLATRLALGEGRPNDARRYLAQAGELDAAASPLLRAISATYESHPALLRNASERKLALQRCDQATYALAALGTGRAHLDGELIAATLASTLQKSAGARRYRQIAAEARERQLSDVEARALGGVAHCVPLSKAAPWITRALDIIEQRLRMVGLEELKANLLSGHSPLYTRLIESLLMTDDTAGATNALLRMKGMLWTEITARRQVSETSDPLALKWVSVKQRLDYWRDASRQAEKPTDREWCQRGIDQAEEALLNAARLRVAHIEGPPLPDLIAIQKRLREHDTLIDFMVASKHIWACIITNTSEQPVPQWFKLVERETLMRVLGRMSLMLGDLERAAPQSRRAAATAQYTAFQELARQLFAMLLLPMQHALQHTNRFIISPDGPLHAIPWAALTALIDDISADVSPTSRVLMTTPSGALFTFDWNTSRNYPETGAVFETPAKLVEPLVLGCVGDPPLQFVNEECAGVGASTIQARVIAPARVADIRFRQTPRWLHIAAHAHVRREAPLLSFIQLEDGNLLLAEALRLPLLGTQLVTLSACETAVIPEQGGSLLALGGAFLCAGAASALASLWRVDDEATRLMMPVFYAELERGHDAATALSSAQHQLIRSGYAHPYFWAGFQLLSRQL